MDEVQQYKCGYCGFFLNSQCQNLLEHECMMDLYEEGIHNLVVDNNQILTVEMKSTGARVFKEAAMFGRDWEETFIRLVQERPALYNIQLPLMQRTNAKKNQLWKEIFNTFGEKISIEELQKNGGTLGTVTFVLKKMNEYKPSGSEAIQTPDSGFRHFQLMKFLDDGTSEQATVCSVDVRVEPSTSGVSSGKSSAGSTTTPLTSPTEMMTPTQRLKRKKDGKKNEKKDLEGQILKAFSNTSAQMDGVDGFLLRLGESLRRLPYRERAKLEIKIMQLLYETEEKLNI